MASLCFSYPLTASNGKLIQEFDAWAEVNADGTVDSFTLGDFGAEITAGDLLWDSLTAYVDSNHGNRLSETAAEERDGLFDYFRELAADNRNGR